MNTHSCSVAAVGDSTTWGFPYGPQASWLAMLEAKFPECSWHNMGVNGDTFAGMLYRLSRQPAVQEGAYSHCILSSGLNDCYSDVSLAAVERDIEEIRQLLERAGSRLILAIPINTQPIGWWFDDKLIKMQKLIADFAAAKEIPVLDFRGLEADDFSDDIHPNHSGYAKMGAAAVQFWLSQKS